MLSGFPDSRHAVHRPPFLDQGPASTRTRPFPRAPRPVVTTLTAVLSIDSMTETTCAADSETNLQLGVQPVQLKLKVSSRPMPKKLFCRSSEPTAQSQVQVGAPVTVTLPEPRTCHDKLCQMPHTRHFGCLWCYYSSLRITAYCCIPEDSSITSQQKET